MQSAKGRDCTNTTTLPKAWVICDLKPRELGLLLATLQQKGDHNDKVNDVTGLNRQCTEDLYQQKPDLHWIAPYQPTTKQGSRANRRQPRKEVVAAEAQTDNDRTCVIRVQFQETGEIETGTELSGEKPCKEVLNDNSSCQPETAQDMKTTANWNKAEITLCSLETCRRTGQPTKHRLHVLTNANISSDPQCHCDQYQEQHEHDIDRNAKVDSRQLAIGMILDSLITPVPGFACEPCGVGPSQVMRTADDVASKGRVDESQPELGKQKQSQLETNAKRKKSKHGKRIQFQETGELETKTELSGETGHPEAKIRTTHTSHPTNQQKRDKEREQAGVEVKRKPQQVEQHFDDCGNDSTPLSHLQENSDNDYDDVAKPYSRESFTIKLLLRLVRPGYQAGPNVELMCGYDFLKADYRWNLFEHLNHCRPLALIISTPCNGQEGFSALNRAAHPDEWRRNRRTSLALDGIATETTRLQLKERRHFVIEQPLNSDVFQTKDWKKLKDEYQISRVTVNQGTACRMGKHTLKPTNFRGSRRQFFEGLRKFKCNGKHECASLENSWSNSRTDNKHGEAAEDAECAPDSRRTLCASISDYPCQNRSDRQSYAANVWECGACKRTLLNEHPSHTRREGEYRFPTVVRMDLACPVCLTGNRPNDHSGHTRAAGECQMAPMAANPPRERRSATRVRGYKPVTPAPVTHEDSSGVLSPTAPAPDAPEAEPAPPTEAPVEELPTDNGDTATTSSSGARPSTRMSASDERRLCFGIMSQKKLEFSFALSHNRYYLCHIYVLA